MTTAQVWMNRMAQLNLKKKVKTFPTFLHSEVFVRFYSPFLSHLKDWMRCPIITRKRPLQGLFTWKRPLPGFSEGKGPFKVSLWWERAWSSSIVHWKCHPKVLMWGLEVVREFKIHSLWFSKDDGYSWVIGILPANTRYRLVGNANPHLVENVGQVERAGQKQIRSRASAYKLHICTC